MLPNCLRRQGYPIRRLMAMASAGSKGGTETVPKRQGAYDSTGRVDRATHAQR